MADSLSEIIRALAAGVPLSASQLSSLVELPASRQAEFLTAWDGQDEAAKLRVLDGLRAISEENLRVEFSRVYRLAARDAAAAVRARAIRDNFEDESEEFLSTLLIGLGDSSAEVREAAAEALGGYVLLSEVGQLEPKLVEPAHTALAERVRDTSESTGVRGEALASLGYSSSPEVEQLIRESASQPELERSAVRAMGRSADPAWIPRLEQYSRHAEPGLRAEAATAFAEIEDEAALPRLLEMVDDPSLEVRASALRALGYFASEDAREALLYASESPEPEIVAAARAGLEQLEQDEETFGDI